MLGIPQPRAFRFLNTKDPLDAVSNCILHLEMRFTLCVLMKLYILSVSFWSQAKEKLLQGEELEESFVAEIILEKLNSPEIKHYGTLFFPSFLHFPHICSVLLSTHTYVSTVHV